MRRVIVVVVVLFGLIAGEVDYDTYVADEKVVDAKEEESYRRKKSYGELYKVERDVVSYLEQRFSKLASILRKRKKLENEIRDDPRLMEILLKWRDGCEKDIRENKGEKLSSTVSSVTGEFDMRKNMFESFGLTEKYDAVLKEIAEEQVCEATCQNGGTCQIEDIKLFSCICVAGFIGEFCQYDVNECELRDFIPCTADKKCVNTFGSYYCTCREGFSIQDGDFCRAILTCEWTLCENGGKCVRKGDKVGGWICKCPLGFKGELCEIELRGCSGDPCPPNLTCVATDAQEADHACIPRPAEREAEPIFELDLSSDLVFCLSVASVVCVLGGFSAYRRCHRKKIASLNERVEELESRENISV